MAVGFTSDGTLVAGDNLGQLSLIDVGNRTIRQLPTVVSEPVFSISAAPDGDIVAVGRGDGSLDLWNIKDDQRLARASGHADSTGVDKYVECIDWLSDGHHLCTWGGYDARIWSVR